MKLVALVHRSGARRRSAARGGAGCRPHPGMRAPVPACAAAGPYWPTMTLALSGDTAWVACKEQSRIVRIALPGGRRTATRALGGAGHRRRDRPRLPLGARLELDALPPRRRAAPRHEAHPARRERGVQHLDRCRLGLGRRRPGRPRAAGLTRDEPGRRPHRGRGRPCRHGLRRDASLAPRRTATTRSTASTRRRNAATRLATVGGDDAAAERIALLGGSLWITGRGVPLLEVDPETGATRRSIDIGGTGIDVVAAAGSLWIPARTARRRPHGLPDDDGASAGRRPRAPSRRQRPRRAGSTSTASPRARARSGSPTTRRACCTASRRDRGTPPFVRLARAELPR